MTDPRPSTTPRRHCMVVYARYPLAETRVQREAEALVAAGFEVQVLCLRRAGEEAPRERYRGVDVVRLPVEPEKRSLARQLWSYLRFGARASVELARRRARPFTSVQVHNLPDFLVFAALVPKLRGVPVLLDLHDLMPEFFAGRFPGKAGGIAARAIALQERLACLFADHVITVSDHWRTALLRRGVAPSDCSVVMNVADGAVFRPVVPAPTRTDGTFRLIYHGTLTRRYGLDLAIEAVARLRDELPDLRLTVLGRGDDLEPLRALRDRLDLRDRVEIEGEIVLAEDLPPILAAADAGVVPYRDDVFTDGLLPTKLMEYAVLGIPSIAARTTAIAGTFGEEMVAMFTPGDVDDLVRCIRELHGDAALRARLSAGGRDFAERYAWERIGADYVSLVERLTAASRASRS